PAPRAARPRRSSVEFLGLTPSNSTLAIAGPALHATWMQSRTWIHVGLRSGYCPAMRWVYDFADGSRDMRDLLGGKGANVAEMTRVLGADRVPAGFTITTEACVAYMRDGDTPDGMDEQVREALERLQE